MRSYDPAPFFAGISREVSVCVCVLLFLSRESRQDLGPPSRAMGFLINVISYTVALTSNAELCSLVLLFFESNKTNKTGL